MIWQRWHPSFLQTIKFSTCPRNLFKIQNLPQQIAYGLLISKCVLGKVLTRIRIQVHGLYSQKFNSFTFKNKSENETKIGEDRSCFPVYYWLTVSLFIIDLDKRVHYWGNKISWECFEVRLSTNFSRWLLAILKLPQDTPNGGLWVGV